MHRSHAFKRSNLNDAENLYFLDVQTRVNAKLAEIQ